MSDDFIIDLDKLAGHGKVRNLSGKERGVAARNKFNIDDLDKSSGIVEVIFPEYLDTISPSYFQGMFSQSIVTLKGKEKFLEKYRFKANSQIMRWVDIGIRNATMSRTPLI